MRYRWWRLSPSNFVTELDRTGRRSGHRLKCPDRRRALEVLAILGPFGGWRLERTSTLRRLQLRGSACDGARREGDSSIASMPRSIPAMAASPTPPPMMLPARSPAVMATSRSMMGRVKRVRIRAAVSSVISPAFTSARVAAGAKYFIIPTKPPTSATTSLILTTVSAVLMASGTPAICSTSCEVIAGALQPRLLVYRGDLPVDDAEHRLEIAVPGGRVEQERLGVGTELDQPCLPLFVVGEENRHAPSSSCRLGSSRLLKRVVVFARL